MPTVHLTQDDAADDLLSRDPLALLLGMLLDQQVPMEWAFSAPKLLAERMGASTLSAHDLAAADPGTVEAWFKGPPALHRYPGSMAKRAQALAQALVDTYDGRTEDLWTGVADGRELFTRLSALPGFGAQKAKIFVALLGKRYEVQPQGWRGAAGDYGEEGSYRSVADIVDAESLQKVRATKQEAKRAAKAAKGS
ncbi:HhH-GPD-type base excision DNA repair protein [Kineococcus sp. NPDC059986]|uniref:HhH-GPD-type base excision DNA repair protein n=1 Tax=Kineococcus sp. NPDC059986 TaxID=3155538 RepID=UPI00344C8445